jgi:hypothetical protein
MLTIRIVLGFIFLLPLLASAQESDFSLVYLSSEITYPAARLQKEIKLAKSLKEVRQLVQKKISGKKGWIMVIYKQDGEVYRWEKNLGGTVEESTQRWNHYGRRGPGTLKVYEPEGFAEAAQRYPCRF